MTNTIEYRVRPVTRYVLTRYESNENGSGCITVSEFERSDTAFHVGCALAREDADRATPVAISDEETKVIWPEHPDHQNPDYGFEVKPF